MRQSLSSPSFGLHSLGQILHTTPRALSFLEHCQPFLRRRLHGPAACRGAMHTGCNSKRTLPGECPPCDLAFL
ncbi:MAG: hypothetical protein MZV63_23060 [Marinilabiliales bacterium]|nr:hypothetical protein [Marinilabiliales bacterium]